MVPPPPLPSITYTDGFGEESFRFGFILVEIAERKSAGTLPDAVWLHNHAGRPVLADRAEGAVARVFVEPDACTRVPERLVDLNAGELAFLLVDWPSGRSRYLHPRHHREHRPLLGRQWQVTTSDCYALLRDAAPRLAGIELPAVVPEIGYTHFQKAWENRNLFLELYAEASWAPVAVPAEHDVLLIQSIPGDPRGPDHCALIVEDGQILHHYRDRLSCVQPYGGWWRARTHLILRHGSRR
ncbi:MAG TPA: NlpC/P60 family protein [Azospirillum sp.]|nr:NlpC/P60 family protein [Azospirillum sp.]